MAWCDQAAKMLARSVIGAPCYSVEDYRQELASNPDCRLFRLTAGAELVGFVILRVERYSRGAEGVIVAGVARLAGARLFAAVLPALEGLFQGVTSYRIEGARRGTVRECLRLGYLPTHVELRRPAAARARAWASRDDMLDDLAQCNVDALGGGDVRARPGRYHGGGRSSSSSQQVTQNTDRRQVLDNGAVGISSDGGSVSVSVLDAGAVKGALDLVNASDQRSAQSLGELLGFTKDVFTQGLGVLDKAGKQVEAQTALVAKAYDQARGEGTQKNLIAAAALATVAVVAVKVWGK